MARRKGWQECFSFADRPVADTREGASKSAQSFSEGASAKLTQVRGHHERCYWTSTITTWADVMACIIKFQCDSGLLDSEPDGCAGIARTAAGTYELRLTLRLNRSNK
jgi:hypothetical protein